MPTFKRSQWDIKDPIGTTRKEAIGPSLCTDDVLTAAASPEGLRRCRFILLSSPLLGGLVARAAVVKATARVNFNEVNFDISCFDVFFRHFYRRAVAFTTAPHGGWYAGAESYRPSPEITIFDLGFMDPNINKSSWPNYVLLLYGHVGF